MESKITGVLELSKKKRMRTLIVAIIVVVLIIIAFFSLYKYKESKSIKDISIKNNILKIDAKRDFFYYDEEPNNLIEAQNFRKGIAKVVIDGTADFNNEKFDGIIKVDNYELKGDVVGYTANCLESDKSTRWKYIITGMVANKETSDEEYICMCDLTISADLKEIMIIFFYSNSGKKVVVYSRI